jgi:hypothetical protein
MKVPKIKLLQQAEINIQMTRPTKMAAVIANESIVII